MTGRAQQDAPAHHGAAGRLPSREGAVAASLPATADLSRHDERLIAKVERIVRWDAERGRRTVLLTQVSALGLIEIIRRQAAALRAKNETLGELGDVLDSYERQPLIAAQSWDAAERNP